MNNQPDNTQGLDEIFEDYRKHAGWSSLISSNPEDTRTEETLKQAILQWVSDELVSNIEIVLRHDIANAAPPCEHTLEQEAEHQAYCGFINKIWTTWASNNGSNYRKAINILKQHGWKGDSNE